MALSGKYSVHFSYFYNHLGFKLFVAVGLSILVGVLDGVGLAMFLPLLQVVDNQAKLDAESMGNLSFLVKAFPLLGIEITIASVLLIMLFFFVLKGIARFAEANFRVNLQQYFIKKLRFDNVNRLSKFDYKAFVRSDVGRIQNTMTSEVGKVARAFQSYMTSLQYAILILVYVGLAILSNPEFSLLVAVGALATNLVYRQIYKRTKEISRKITKDGHVFQGLLIQSVTFFKYLKATGLSDMYAQKLRTSIDNIERGNKKIGYYGAILAATREPLIVLVVVIVILVQVSYFSASLGLIILSLLFFYRSLTNLMALQTAWNGFLNNFGALEGMKSFTRELERGQEKIGNRKVEKFQSDLALVDVDFFFGKTHVLKNVSLKINKNESIAIVGESGSGKTSLVNILAGLVHVDSGQFLIDGIDSRELDLNYYRRRVGYITQDPVIFSDTIFNNVTLWAEDNEKNRALFWEVLHKASIDDFVGSLAKKEYSLLGNNGIQISGGQKQRLSIARELFKDIDVLILDEATSSLDSETELSIQDNLGRLKGKYTILTIAHRLSTIKDSDRIILMQKGQIEAIGDFNSLKKESKVFERAVSIQNT